MSNTVTPDALVDLDIPKDVRISPDGHSVVYSVSPVGRKGEHSLSSIWLAAVGQENSARQLTSGQHNDRSPKWAPDGQSIVFLSDRNKSGKSVALYRLVLDCGEPVPVTNVENAKEISEFEWSPDGTFIAFLSPDETAARDEAREKSKDDVQIWGAEWEFNRLRLLHVSTKHVCTLVERKLHVSQLAWSPDSKSILYTLLETPECDSGIHGVQFETVRIANKISEPVIKFPNPLSNRLLWHGDQVWFMSCFSDNLISSNALYKLNVETKTYSWSAFGETDDAAGLQSLNGIPYVKSLAGLYDRIHCLDPGLVLYEAPHDLKTWDVYKKDEGKYIIVIGKGMVGSPMEIYSCELKVDAAKNPASESVPEKKHDSVQVRLSNHGHALRNTDLASMKHLYCKSSDGEVELDALLVSPSPSKPMPTVVSIHGGPTARSTESFEQDYWYWGPLLLQNKCALLMPNYRGGTSHGDSFVAYARGKMGTKEYDDIITIVDEGIRQGHIDKDRIIVSGWSQGGFLSYLCAVRNSSSSSSSGGGGKGWNFKGAICGAGVTDWDMLVMSSDAPALEAALAGGMPWEKGRDKNDTSSRSGSAIWEMRGTNVPPILILHGATDVRVPVAQAVAFQRACRYYDIPCEMAVYPREGHMFAERVHLIDMMKRVLRFVDTHIKK